MMPCKRTLALLLSAALTGTALIALTRDVASAQPVPGDPYTLWYDEPASDWESRALPIGNGALGAMVFGGLATERLQFNEKTLWTGGPGVSGYNYGNWNSPRPGAIAGVQSTIDSQRRMSPSDVAARLGQAKVGFGAYQTFGDLWLDVAGTTGAGGYRRYLNLADATAGVVYTAGGVTYSREYLSSFPAGVIAGRLGAVPAGKVSFTLRFSSPRSDKTVSVANGRMTIRGALASNGMRFEAQIRVLNSGGTRTDGADRITVANADSAVFLLAAGTNYADTYPTYRGTDPHAAVTSKVDAAAAQGWAALRAAHVADHQALFNRVRLDLGGVMPAQATDDLRSAYTGARGAADRALEQLYFQYGRYLLIASSRAGSLPANLQGVWNHSTSPPWSSDYHTNINVQMNYWLADATNLGETVEPLTRFVEALRAPGQRTATEMFGSPGWVVHNETNPFGYTGVHNNATSFWFPEAAAWLTWHLYDHYRFTGNVAYLRDRAYPLMKGAAQFWLDNLHNDPRDGKLVVSPSYSPEHGDFSAGASMSQQIVWDLFTNTIEAAGILASDAAFRDQLVSAKARLDPGTRIGSWGQLQEWKTDWDSPTNTHRHVSHLYGLHPGRQIQPGTAFGNAAKVSLNARGDGGTGWSKAWKINFWARLRDGNRAHKMVSEQLRWSTLANLFDTHPPFQIDGNFGATAGIAEMLLQSQTGTVDVLPALPASWPSGSFAGLRARGNLTVDAAWQANGSTTITLAAGTGGPVSVRNAMFNGTFTFTNTATGAPVPVTRNGDTITFDAAAGHSYRAAGSRSANLARGKPAGQSSTAYSAPAARAVDGNTNGDFRAGSVTHTADEANPWWQVDLGSSQPIGSIAVWNRTDCCADRLSDYWVFASDAPFNTALTPTQQAAVAGVWSSRQTVQAGTPTRLTVGRAARYVMVRLAGTGPLSLAEVEVHAPVGGPIVGVASAKCVDVPGGNSQDGTDVALWTCHGGANQQWVFNPGSGEVRGLANKCLDVENGSPSDGTPVQLYQCNGSNGQKWTYESSTQQFKALSKCLDASGGATANGTKLIIWSCHNGTNQQWSLS